MADYVLIAFIAVTLAPAALMFFERKLMNAVICLGISALGSSLLFLYLGQTLVGLLQLFVFVGGLSTYLVIAMASEERHAAMLSRGRFVMAAIVVAAVLSLLLNGISSSQTQTGNSFVSSAEAAFVGQYALIYAAAFLVFATAAGSVLVMKRFSRMVI
jgi:NADH:ubiquinone oxidoreductase subunit 6 (subunit J)